MADGVFALLGRALAAALVLSLTAPPALAAMTRTGPAREARQAAPAPHLPFYVATKARRTVYVLGTLHTAAPADYPPRQPFRAPILAALNASPTLALELSPDDLVESQDDVRRYGVCARVCLPGMLPRRLWLALERRLASNPVALAEVKKARPWLAALLLETYDSLSAGLQTEYGTEAQLQNIYVKGKLIGLETLSDQVRAFATLTLPEQWEMLESDLAQSPRRNAADVRTLHALWREGDADRLVEWDHARSQRLARDPRLARAIDDKLVVERNRHFTARIVKLAQPDKPLFVAIGALHLGGRQGVLKRLERRGFTVRPA